MRKECIIAVVFLAFAAIVIQGCVAVAVGAGAAGTVAYIKGDLETVEAKNLDTVYRATGKAIEQLELNVSSKTKDALEAKFVLRDSMDKKITIKLAATAEGTTKLSIRVGVFGNEVKSRLIYDKIRENLN
jgi:hypothetical protein